jgi:A/G-specific adenine glycosylase
MSAKKRPAQLRLFQPPAAPPLDPVARDRAIAADLGAWFDGAARDLPWRRDRRPYAVWLSEVMLQQTRVETVIPYFERFLTRYPEVSALAAAELDDVLHLWSGLGYYRRARQLHAAAREVTARYGGVFPPEAAALRALPGIGAYTAGAVSSIAYGQHEPLVDGNVARVLSRLEAIDEPIKGPAATKRLWATAARMLPDDRPGRFNEALMELGATVCVPREPRCDACPLAAHCRARAAGRERELPVVTAKGAVPVVEVVAVVLADPRTGALLFARRREGGLFGGLWEPPMVEALSLDEARPRLVALGLGLGRARLRAVGRVTHVLTHRRLEVVVAAGQRAAGSAGREALEAPYEKAAWLDAERPGVGVSTLARKIIAVAAAGAEQKD